MIIIFRGAIAAIAILFAVEVCIPSTRPRLPLGGSHLAQTGIVMAIAIALFELATIFVGHS